MISPAHVTMMARYNRWQNESLYRAAAALTDDARRQDRGAFFGSILGTLNHLLWADQVWLGRFTGAQLAPAGGIKESVNHIAEFDRLEAERVAFDRRIFAWAETVTEAWLAGTLTWHSGSAGRDITRPCWVLVTHFFNHQTHHRGQVHTMLTAAGARPGDTDLMLMPREG